MATTDTKTGKSAYLFDSATTLGGEQLDLLSELLDGVTTEVLESTGVGPGWRCLDVGVGGGSIARWMAARSAPTGSVLGVDLTTDQCEDGPGLEVLRHDITEGVPPGGPFDLIHVRLVLMHLPEREQVFSDLVEALAPGGWLVLGDLGTRIPYALAARTEADRNLFDRVHGFTLAASAAGGQSLDWSYDAHTRMLAAGMEEVESVEHSRTTIGGDAASRYHRNIITQVHEPMLRVGATESELERYREVVLDPELKAWFYQLVFARGRKPEA